MEHNFKFPNFILGNLQREYSLQLASLHMQLLQRSLLFNGIMPTASSPLCFPSYYASGIVNQIQSTPTQSKLPENTIELKPESLKTELKKSDPVPKS